MNAREQLAGALAAFEAAQSKWEPVRMRCLELQEEAARLGQDYRQGMEDPSRALDAARKRMAWALTPWQQTANGWVRNPGHGHGVTPYHPHGAWLRLRPYFGITEVVFDAADYRHFKHKRDVVLGGVKTLEEAKPLVDAILIEMGWELLDE